MKKIILALTIFSFVINGCSSDDNNATPAPFQNSCSNINSFTVTQQGENLHFLISSSGTPVSYDVSYALVSDQLPAGQGSQLYLNNANEDIPASAFQPGSYKFYVRAYCSDGSESAWSQGVVVNIAAFCTSPSQILFDGFSLTWTDNNQTNVSQYQVEFGLSGFNQGTGTLYNTNTTSLDGIPMAADTAYDFYVRSNCAANGGWSSWTGPYTYYSEYTQNMCLAPINLSYVTLYNSSGNAWGAEISYNGNGESLFEVALMSNGQLPGAGDIDVINSGFHPTYVNLSTFGSYTFYVRGICADGNRTAWSTMVIDL